VATNVVPNIIGKPTLFYEKSKVKSAKFSLLLEELHETNRVIICSAKPAQTTLAEAPIRVPFPVVK